MQARRARSCRALDALAARREAQVTRAQPRKHLRCKRVNDAAMAPHRVCCALVVLATQIVHTLCRVSRREVNASLELTRPRMDCAARSSLEKHRDQEGRQRWVEGDGWVEGGGGKDPHCTRC